MSIDPDLITAAHAARVASHTYEAAARRYLEAVEPLPCGAFWPLAAQLGVEIARVGKRYADFAPVFKEFVRRTLFDDRLPHDASDAARRTARAARWLMLAQFVRRWRLTSVQVSNALADVDLEMGDDSFGDFCDLVPFAGADVVLHLTGGRLTTLEAITREVAAVPVLGPIILAGEHYVAMTLRDALIASLASVTGA